MHIPAICISGFKKMDSQLIWKFTGVQIIILMILSCRVINNNNETNAENNSTIFIIPSVINYIILSSPPRPIQLESNICEHDLCFLLPFFFPFGNLENLEYRYTKLKS